MSRYNSEYESVSDSDFGEAADGAERIVERHPLALKIAGFYTVAFVAGLVAFQLVSGSSARSIVAIGLWFTIIFAAFTTIMGGAIKGFEAIKRNRNGYS
ncbi:hypothetical protein HALDL1_08080 [Halobacterium sp. DL1]|jgi:hypothetical protein|nr:hypothetical protein HALDL1_08080 [Halobacterium sp. DL1]